MTAPLSPAEREVRWILRVRFAIEATSESDALSILRQGLSQLARELPLRGGPVARPRSSQNLDNIWIAQIEPDLTHLQMIDPDDARTRCRLVETHFPTPVGASWRIQTTDYGVNFEWPSDIWNRQPGRDDVMLHPAIRAIMISCTSKEPTEQGEN